MNIKITYSIFSLALMLRLIFAGITYHPDIAAFDLPARLINQGNIFNLYDFLSSLSQSDPIRKAFPTYFLNYPPLIYFYHSIFSFLFNPLFSKDFLQDFLFNTQSSFSNIQIFFHLLSLKLPYLLFDLGIGALLYKMVDKEHKFTALYLWLFNPVNLYSTYMMGQFDVIPTFFVVLALYLAQALTLKRGILAALALGAGASFKIFPLFFLIPLAVYFGDWKKRLTVFFIGLLPYIISILPFLSSKGFRSTALVANQTLKSFYAQIAVSGGESIILFITLIVFTYLIFLQRQSESLWSRFFIILLLFFTFTHTHPQWFLWLTPFLILDLIASNYRRAHLVVITSLTFLGSLLFFDPSLSYGLFSPLWPNLYNAPAIWDVLNIKIDYNFSRSLLQSTFVGAALVYIYHYFPIESRNKL